MGYWLIAALLAVPHGASAQPTAISQDASDRTIQVTGTGMVRTVPDMALLDIWLRGEGETPDAATRDLTAKQRAVSGGVLELVGVESELTAGNVIVIEARGSGCSDARGPGSQPRMSTGDCAVVGYVATMQMNLRTAAVEQAGTAAGLASRLGASDARVQGFALSDPDEAQGRASAAAIRAARQRAEAIAAGAGLTLGPVLSMRDQADMIVTGARSTASAPPPPPPPPAMSAPVPIDLKPRPIETRAQVFVTYSIAP